MKCMNCGSLKVHKNGNSNGKQRYKCLECGQYFIHGDFNANGYLNHFGVKVKSDGKGNKISRDTYCVKTNKVSYRERKIVQWLLTNSEKFKIPNDIYLDEETYTDQAVELQYNACMLNFDLNMKYMESLNYDDFNRYLGGLCKKNKFGEVFDLNELDYKMGIYILVLDKYKQIYIGISNNAKKRIMQHWCRNKEFDKLLHGDEYSSVISIDSFGALDTTRIFFKEVSSDDKLHTLEEKIINNADKGYLLNRIAGGVNDEKHQTIRNLLFVGTANKRDLRKYETKI